MKRDAAGNRQARLRTGCVIQSARLVRAVGAICVVLLATACASLPEVRYLDDSLLSTAIPTVANARGDMIAKNSSALMATRWKGLRISHADVMEVVAREEAATGSALITGNKVTLLYDGPQTMAAMSQAIGS